VPEVSQQRRDELAIQLLAMTRADRTARQDLALSLGARAPRVSLSPTSLKRQTL
jgi:hypothetical protein